MMNGRLYVAFGVALMLFALLAASLSSPRTTIGQETDVAIQDGGGSDVGSGAFGPGDQANPPASLPDTGAGASAGGSFGLMPYALLGGLGVTLVATGVVTSRRRRQKKTRN